MKAQTTVAFIGAGNMGSALIRGLRQMEGLSLIGYDMNRERLNALCAECSITAAQSIVQAVTESDYVVLAVKPQHIKEVVKDLREGLTHEQCLVSIAAGVTMDKLIKWVGDRCPVVRVMPNTPALVGSGVTAVCLDSPRLSQEQKDFVRSMFSVVGHVHVLAERLFDAFTALAGSGPAYVYYFMEALVEAGLAQGLPRDQATQIVMELFGGSVKLARDSMTHLSLLREMVTSPAGTTIAALNHLDRQAVRAAIIDAVGQAVRRGVELGD